MICKWSQVTAIILFAFKSIPVADTVSNKKGLSLSKWNNFTEVLQQIFFLQITLLNSSLCNASHTTDRNILDMYLIIINFVAFWKYIAGLIDVVVYPMWKFSAPEFTI